MISLHVIVTEMHQSLCEDMVQYAKEEAPKHDAQIIQVTIAPGSLEIPLTAKEILETQPVEAFVIMGFLEQGKTKHGEVIGHQVTSKLLDLQLQYRVPMAIAIIGPGATLKHAQGKAKATAEKAVRVAVNMVKLKKHFTS